MAYRYINCPMAADLRKARILGQDMARTMRKLRAHQRLCHKCARAPECPILLNYHALIGETVREVLEAWRGGTTPQEE